MTRQDTLAQTERLAFQGVMRAYADLAATEKKDGH